MDRDKYREELLNKKEVRFGYLVNSQPIYCKGIEMKRFMVMRICLKEVADSVVEHLL